MDSRILRKDFVFPLKPLDGTRGGGFLSAFSIKLINRVCSTFISLLSSQLHEAVCGLVFQYLDRFLPYAMLPYVSLISGIWEGGRG